MRWIVRLLTGCDPTGSMMPADLRASVGSRLILRALLLAAAVSLALAASVAAWSWRHELTEVDATAAMIERVRLPSLADAARDGSHRLDEDVAGLAGLPHVAAAELRASGASYRSGHAPPSGALVRTFPLRHRDGGSLGELSVTFDLAAIRRDVLQDAALLTAALALPIATVVAAMLLLFRALVGRHLDDLAAYAHGLTPDTLDRTFAFTGKRPTGDELDRLADALGHMRGSLQQEIRRRGEAEGHLRLSEEHYRAVFDATGDALIVHDIASGLIVEVNRAAVEMYGLTRAELLADGAFPRLIAGEPPWDLASAGIRLQRAISEGRQVFEWRARRGDGSLFWVEVCLTPERFAGRLRVVAAVRDIEARKTAEERASHLQRLQSIGQLAGGVAHDFNNMLAGIQGSVELAMGRLPKDHPVQRHLSIALQSSERAADLTSKLLSFARRHRQVVAPVDFHAVIEAACGLLERSIDRRVAIVRRLAASDRILQGDASELQNAVLNLCLNARDAMPDGGSITITTADTDLDAAACAVIRDAAGMHSGADLRPGRHLRLTVTDTGSGIAADVLPRIFEPFFTTKEVGHGTGLGLSAVHGAVTSHGGWIGVSTSPSGSVFTVLLPVEALPTASGPVSIPDGPAALTGHALVIDDESTVRATSAAMLSELGYTVYQASDVAAAERAFAERTYNLVLLDIVMPGEGGQGCWRRIRAQNPHQPIVLCSGNIRDTAVEAMLAEGRSSFLHKPFRLAALSEALVAAGALR